MEFHNYCEYTVDAKKEGKLRLKRNLLILCYVAFAVTFMTAVFVTKIIPFGALVVLLTAILVFFTWRYVNIEYEYVISSGEIKFSEIYGRRSRKDVLEIKIRDMSLIAPYKDGYKEKADAVARKYFAVSTMSSPDVYFAIFQNAESTEERAVFFEATSKSLKLFEFYNRAATVKSEVRY